MSETQPQMVTTAATGIAELKNPSKYDVHSHVRWFLGPMPHKLITVSGKQPKAKASAGLHQTTSITDDESLSQIIKDHAFSFFIREGGKAEDWGENTEIGIREEMLRKWTESEWGKIWRKKLDGGKQENKGWIGASFEVGEFLGVNVLENERMSLNSKRSNRSLGSGASVAPSASSMAPLSTIPAVTGTTIGETFVTAPESSPVGNVDLHVPQMPAAADDPFAAGPSDPKPLSFVLPRIASSSEELPGEQSSSSPRKSPSPKRPLPVLENINDTETSSVTGLLRPPLTPQKSKTEVMLRPIFRSPSSTGAKSDGSTLTKNKGKGKLVNFVDKAPSTPGPAPPNEVLERTGSEVNVTSAAATIDASLQGGIIQSGDVIMRGMFPGYPLLFPNLI